PLDRQSEYDHAQRATDMKVPILVWGITLLATCLLFVFDFVAHGRRAHEPSFAEAGCWSAVYVLLALLFCGGLWYFAGSPMATEFLTGYITEKTLSVDNLIVFMLIMSSFRVPAIHQQKILLIGVAVALVLR